MVAGAPQMSHPRVQGGSNRGFYDLAVEVTPHHGHRRLLVTQASSDSVWGETLQRHEQQKSRRIGGHPGGWLPHGFTSYTEMISVNPHHEGLRTLPILQRGKLRHRE